MKVFFLSLGCDKNLVDSEVMLGLLSKASYTITDSEETADVIIINTCGFIADATEEGINSAIEMAVQKRTGACKALILTGCMVVRYRDEIFKELPEVDAIVGAADYDKIVTVIERVLEGEKNVSVVGEGTEKQDNDDLPAERLLSTPSYYAYLKIAEGCDNHCTYCTIPSIRGKYKSRKMESILTEATKLAEMGVKELIVVAQDTGYYGMDIYGEKRLHVLLNKLAQVDGIEWIRILYCYPENITDELINEMATNEKVCKYIDMPIQHADNEILKLMGRTRCTKETLLSVIERLRSAMPDISIRTTVIVGFPQESVKHFESLKMFLKEVRFDKLGVFAYSREEGTPAHGMDGQVDDDVKESRRHTIMDMQKRISLEKNAARVGHTYKVVVDGFLPENRVYCGRSYADCVDVDGVVFFECEYELLAGDFLNIKVVEASEYDLIGVID